MNYSPRLPVGIFRLQALKTLLYHLHLDFSSRITMATLGVQRSKEFRDCGLSSHAACTGNDITTELRCAELAGAAELGMSGDEQVEAVPDT
jgi:hypothetical protein